MASRGYRRSFLDTPETQRGCPRYHTHTHTHVTSSLWALHKHPSTSLVTTLSLCALVLAPSLSFPLSLLFYLHLNVSLWLSITIQCAFFLVTLVGTLNYIESLLYQCLLVQVCFFCSPILPHIVVSLCRLFTFTLCLTSTHFNSLCSVQIYF